MAQRVVWRIAGLFVLALCSCVPEHARPVKLTPAQRAELETLTRQLGDPERLPKTKIEAAELLLARPYPQATGILAEFLASSSDRSARAAVARAIAKRGAWRGQFIKPLMAMLTGQDATLRTPAAEALAGYQDPGVTAGLLGVAADRGRDRAMRIVVIQALGKVLDKQAVDGLVRLLDDKEPAIRRAACQALTKLTNIRTFGHDAGRWKRWWAANKHKTRSEWLADLAEALARAQRAAEAENAVLSERLGQAMTDLYAATPAAQRDARLLSFLTDPLAEVRLIGAKLTDGRIVSNQDVPPQVRRRIRAMLADADRRVRRASALLLANLEESGAVDDLLARVGREEELAVREGLLVALGRLRDPKALPAILPEILSKHEGVAAAAAVALAGIASKQPLADEQRDQAAKALIGRYRTAARAGDGAELRGRLLTAMGLVGRAEFVDVLQTALKDTNASVRLAAVNGLARLGQADSANALVGLADDADRGVRRAVIAALGTLGGLKNLQTILKRTDPQAESDQAVREQAWEVVMKLLAAAETDVLSEVAAALAKRTDARDQRIDILKKLVSLLKADQPDKLPAALRQLGTALRQASRPAEAAPHLARAHAILHAAGSPKAPTVWAEWIDVLLAADDPAVTTAMADQKDAQAFAWAWRRLRGHLGGLAAKQRYATVILLASEATKGLANRLSEAQQAALAKSLSEAKSKQRAADTKHVADLVTGLSAANESARSKAAAELHALGDRAVGPLLAELAKLLRTDEPAKQVEKAILDVLRKIAPNLTGYDPAAGKDERIKIVDKWLGG